MAVDSCPVPPPQPVHGVVRFVAAEFIAAYPAFAAVNPALLQSGFDIATLFLNNSCCSIVQNAKVREQLLYMVTAHVAALLQGENGLAPSGIVGRIASATEGSTAISADYAANMSMSEAYFSQTKYGAMFWQATTVYRSMHYFPPTPSNYGGFRTAGLFPWGRGGG